VEHSYADAGTFDVTLTVADNRGGRDTLVKSISVTRPNSAPTADFTKSVTNLDVALDAGGSSDSDGTIASYEWDFGDGESASGRAAQHRYATAGTYDIRLTVADDRGATGTTVKQVSVTAPNQIPVASFTHTSTDLRVSLDASGASDPDGQIASYSWDMGVAGGQASGKTATYTYSQAGTYAVKLTVTDERGAAASVTRNVTVSLPAPGLVQPGAGNTGVPDGVSLTRVDGDVVITTPGTVLDRVDVRGFVQVRAANVTIRRSVIRGGVATVDTGLVNVTTAGASLVMEDSTLIPQSPSYRIDGVRGSNFTLRRVEITGTVDGVHVHGSTDVNDGGNVRVESSWLHDFTFYPNDPRHSDGSHNDAVQIIGGKGIALVGNTLTGANNAAVQVTQNRNVVANVTMDRNWADNGGCTFNVNRNPRAVMSGIVMTGNRFGRATRNSNCAIVISRDQPHTSSGNVWLDNGQAVTIKTG
jgi:PKD repeat protein